MSPDAGAYCRIVTGQSTLVSAIQEWPIFLNDNFVSGYLHQVIASAKMAYPRHFDSWDWPHFRYAIFLW